MEEGTNIDPAIRGTNADPRIADQFPTHDEIAKLAYQIWDAHGRVMDYDVQNWLAAEGVLMMMMSKRPREYPIDGEIPVTPKTFAS